jgi:hypothetical protein
MISALANPLAGQQATPAGGLAGQRQGYMAQYLASGGDPIGSDAWKADRAAGEHPFIEWLRAQGILPANRAGGAPPPFGPGAYGNIPGRMGGGFANPVGNNPNTGIVPPDMTGGAGLVSRRRVPVVIK